LWCHGVWTSQSSSRLLRSYTHTHTHIDTYTHNILKYVYTSLAGQIHIMLKRPADCWLVLSRTRITYVRARPARAKISTANGPADGVLYAHMYVRYIHICILCYIYIKTLLLFSVNIIICDSSKLSSLSHLSPYSSMQTCCVGPSFSGYLRPFISRWAFKEPMHTISANRAPYSSTSSDFYQRLATKHNNYTIRCWI